MNNVLRIMAIPAVFAIAFCAAGCSPKQQPYTRTTEQDLAQCKVDAYKNYSSAAPEDSSIQNYVNMCMQSLRYVFCPTMVYPPEGEHDCSLATSRLDSKCYFYKGQC